MSKNIWLLGYLVGLLPGCATRETSAPLDLAVVDTLPGGVVRVVNAGPTAWSDTNGWRLVEELRIDPPDGSPGEFGHVRNVVATRDGTIITQESDPIRLRVYSSSGEWLRNIGREGDGPGEFHDGLLGISDDVLIIQDPNHTRLTTFTLDGKFIQSVASQCCWWPSAMPVFEDRTIAIAGPAPASAKDRQGALYLTRLDGTVADTILFPPRAPSETDPATWTVTLTTPTSSSMMGVSIPLKPSEASAYFLTRQKVVGNTSKYSLAIISLQGDTLRLFSAPAQEFSITAGQRDSIYDETINGVQERWREAMKEVAKVGDIPLKWPAWSGVAVDGASRIWVSRPGPRGAASVLDVFSPDGVLLGSVTPPTEKVLEGFWTAERVYLLEESAAGRTQIVVYRIQQ